MRAFIDTSSLIKKYQMEPGRDKLLKMLDAIDEIVVSPVTYIELLCSIQRNCEESRLPRHDLLRFKEEVDLDFGYYLKIPLNEDLERAAFDLRQKHPLKSLDLIQLSSAKIAHAKIFITSDKFLHKIACQEFKHNDVELI